jgi:hypothetical protein
LLSSSLSVKWIKIPAGIYLIYDLCQVEPSDSKFWTELQIK